MDKSQLIADGAASLALARKREMALLRGRVEAADAARVKLQKAVASASQEDIAALRGEVATIEAKLTAEIEACVRRLDQLENAPARSWRFTVVRDDAGAIAEVVANPTE